MRQKKYFILAAAALALAACSSDDAITEQNQPQQLAPQEVGFSAYLNRATTRAGQAGVLNLDALKTSGFGVFGYYTDNELYSESSKPNFMYNQEVTWGSEWTYTPVKYWPNEFGSEAISEAQDKLTFFAYAPYVEVVPETGLLADQTENASGIVALTRNTASGDPYVKYLVDMDPENGVDFCWGVAAENFTSSVVTGLNSINAGEVFKNVSKPETDSKLKFEFNHALAALNVQIDADVDIDEHALTPDLATGTKVYVRSVTFEGFASKGMFNLNAAKAAPKWYDMTGNNELTSGKVTIYDGRRDGSEGQVNAAASNETPNNLNPVIIQNNPATTGVPATSLVNLFDSNTADASIYVIPVGDEQLKVTIVYDVETADLNLAGYLSDGTTKGSTIENKITKAITIGDTATALKLVAGKKYVIKLHLGLTSVKFDADVEDWADGDTGEPWLPINETPAP